MNSIIRRIILVSVFLLPFIVFPRGFFASVFPKYLFITFVTLLTGSLFLIGKLYKNNKDENVPKNITLLIFGFYVLAILISCLNGVVPSLSFWSTFDHEIGALFIVILFALFLVTSSVFKKIEDWYKLFTVFVASGIIFTLGSFMSAAGVKFSKFLDITIQGGFTIGNSSWTGIYMAFVFFISLGLAFSSTKKSHKIFGIIGMITSFFDPTLTGFIMQAPGAQFGPIGWAQTASYSMWFGIGVFVLYLIFRRIKLIKWRKVFITSLLSVFVIGLISVSIVGLAPARNLIAQKAGPNRLVFWNIAIEGWKEKPLLGWGSDSYQFVYGKYFDPIVLTPGYAPEYWVDRAHNYYFDTLVANGLVGLVSLLSLYGIMLFGLLRKAVSNTNKEGLLYMSLFVGIISFMIQGLMLFQTIVGWFIIMLLMAFVGNFCFKDRTKIDTAIVEKSSKNNKKQDTNTGFNIFISTIIIVVFCVLFTFLIRKPYKVNMGLSEFPIMSYSQRIEFFNRLDNAYVGNMNDLGSAFSNYHVKLRRVLKNGLKDNEKKMMIEEIKVINKVLENGLERQKYLDVKLLMSNIGFYSIIIGLAPEEERQTYYDKGMFYVNKMGEISDQNPVVKTSKAILDISLKYGEEGFNLFDTSKPKQ